MPSVRETENMRSARLFLLNDLLDFLGNSGDTKLNSGIWSQLGMGYPDFPRFPDFITKCKCCTNTEDGPANGGTEFVIEIPPDLVESPGAT
jgi:hypothetical protein